MESLENLFRKNMMKPFLESSHSKSFSITSKDCASTDVSVDTINSTDFPAAGVQQELLGV
jgi:hypothetical protein